MNYYPEDEFYENEMLYEYDDEIRGRRRPRRTASARRPVRRVGRRSVRKIRPRRPHGKILKARPSRRPRSRSKRSRSRRPHRPHFYRGRWNSPVVVEQPAPLPAEPVEPSSEFVRWVQLRLNQILGLSLAVDGIMSASTRSAIRDFQRREKLPETGIVGPQTKDALIAVGADAKDLAQPEEEYFLGDWWDSIRGSSGEVDRKSTDYIKWVQASLNKIMRIKLVVDGDSGIKTRSAIRNFQKRNGLTADGIVGEQTEKALRAAGASKPPTVKKSSSFSDFSSFFGFKPIPVESPGGGRVKDKSEPRLQDRVKVKRYGSGTVTLHKYAAKALEAMTKAARRDGIPAPLLEPVSGYRSIATQKRLWEQGVKKHGSAQAARKWIAVPGGSAHHSGRAIDLWMGYGIGKRNVAAMEKGKAFKWMVKNAERFGFYPYDAEPWHWEYNPPASGQGEVYEMSYESTFGWDDELGC